MADTKGHTRGRGTTSGMAGATGATGPPGLPEASEPSGLPEPTESPEPLGLPEPSESPEPSGLPEPTEPPEPPEPSGPSGPSGLPKPFEPSEPFGLPESTESPEPTEPPEPSGPSPLPKPSGPPEPREPLKTPEPPGTAARGALVSSLAVDILLPLLVYYAARALGAGQAPALLLSGAPPAVRLMVGAVRYRRINGVDLFLTMLLVIAALVSLIGGGPRVLLFKNAALSLAVGGWALGTAFTRRPLAFQLGQHLHTGSAVRARAGIWRDSAPFRRGLRVLTLLWGAEQLLDGGLSALAAAMLPTDTVPLLDRVVSLVLLGLTAGATLVYAHRFRIRHALPLFGAPAPMTSRYRRG
ncbi:VC0807 family protein [Streptomyces sp. FBKL.4005]|uniref:VC0807 family protein n=1 Tax=Streptomyces sp. FBKL.4005 TaxID=2015515 RepID=UPI001CB8A575|nr:VC0807 family protein [Streptomyces sp. FBKL.4005]